MALYLQLCIGSILHISWWIEKWLRINHAQFSEGNERKFINQLVNWWTTVYRAPPWRARRRWGMDTESISNFVIQSFEVNDAYVTTSRRRAATSPPPPCRRRRAVWCSPNASIKFSSSDVMKVHVENQPMPFFKLQAQACLKKSKGCLIAFNI